MIKIHIKGAFNNIMLCKYQYVNITLADHDYLGLLQKYYTWYMINELQVF